MTVIATASNPRFSVSRVDIDRGGPTYTRTRCATCARSTPTPTSTSSPAPTRWPRSCRGRTGRRCSRSPGSSASAGPATNSTASTSQRRSTELPDDALHPGRGARAGDLVDRLPQARRGEPADLVPGARRRRAVRRPSAASTAHAPPTQETARDRLRRSHRRWPTVAARAAAAKLADDVVVIDVSGQLVITDCFVIASASNERQVNAIVDEVEEKMRLAGYKPARREGAREGRWTLLDYVDIVVHIQHQDERNFYALDRLVAGLPGRPGRSGRARDAHDDPPPGDAAARPDRVQRRQPHAGPARHRALRPGPRAGRRGRRGAGQTSAAADRVVGSAARARHRGRARRAVAVSRWTSTPGCAKRISATGRA